VKPSKLWASLLGFTVVVGALFTLVFVTDRTPVLGLDLKGGLSVIYATAEPATEDDLIVVRDLMRDQLEDFGIAEPDVRVEGENVIVDLPGVSDQAEAFEALKVSGIVELRPVLQCQAVVPTDPDATTVPGATPVPGSTVPGSTLPGSSVAGPSTSLPASDASISTTPTTAPAIGESATGESASALAAPHAFAMAAANPRATPTTTPATTPTTAVAETATTLPADVTVPETAPPIAGPPAPTTTVAPDTSGQDVLESLNGDEICIVGPAGSTGEVFERGSAGVGLDQSGGWMVNVSLRDDGLAAWNALATACNSAGPTCPSQRLAIVLDDTIQSAPTVQQPVFDNDIQITGAFEESEARGLARVLNRGAFPVQIEQQRVETVSATAGEDSLNAAVIAGLIGVAVMLAFMVFYYRKLAVAIVIGLGVWAMTVFAMASFVSNTWNYAFTIAGATGLIISVGITIDSYVVFFERIRDETRHGRSPSNAAVRSFQSSWKTILAADFVSLLAAFILFWLSVGSVKGFALYLGMTTICDLLVFYFVTRPAVFLLTQTRWFNKRRQARVAAGSATPAIGATS
jgi:preprotein translocase subunit SecD